MTLPRIALATLALTLTPLAVPAAASAGTIPAQVSYNKGTASAKAAAASARRRRYCTAVGAAGDRTNGTSREHERASTYVVTRTCWNLRRPNRWWIRPVYARHIWEHVDGRGRVSPTNPFYCSLGLSDGAGFLLRLMTDTGQDWVSPHRVNVDCSTSGRNEAVQNLRRRAGVPRLYAERRLPTFSVVGAFRLDLGVPDSPFFLHSIIPPFELPF